MESNDPALDCVAQLLMINRVFAAHDLNEDVTFATRWARHVGGKVPSKRDVMFKKNRVVVNSAPDLVLGLTRATKALAVMELILICTPPLFTHMIIGSNISLAGGDLDSGTSLPIIANKCATCVVTLRSRHQVLGTMGWW